MRPKTIDDYNKKFDKNTREKLETIRKIIRKNSPENYKEIISYGMPAFKGKRILVYYSAWKNHIGIYGAKNSDVVNHFKKELKNYETSKGTIKFPLNKKLPVSLISKIIKFRVKQLEN